MSATLIPFTDSQPISMKSRSKLQSERESGRGLCEFNGEPDHARGPYHHHTKTVHVNPSTRLDSLPLTRWWNGNSFVGSCSLRSLVGDHFVRWMFNKTIIVIEIKEEFDLMLIINNMSWNDLDDLKIYIFLFGYFLPYIPIHNFIPFLIYLLIQY